MYKCKKVCFIGSIVMMLMLLAATVLTVQPKTEGSAAETSVLSFARISETECSVRLSDKTVSKSVVIPEKVEIDGVDYTVTSIAANGFSSAVNMPKVRLPRTIKTIGNAAFANCKSMMSITIPNVEMIGTNAFNMCTSLEYLIIPESAKVVASTILRSTNTQVYVRVSQARTQELGWAANWNVNNANQTVEYNSLFIPEIEYKALYDVSPTGIDTRNAEAAYYVVDSAQPFSEERADGGFNVYIPSHYNGAPVIGIENGAFSYNDIVSLTIGYAEEPINIASYAFNGLYGEKIIINREVTFNDVDWMGYDINSEYLFADSTVTSNIMPENITGIGQAMFSDCINLKDVYFDTPQAGLSEEQEQDLLDAKVSTCIINIPSTVTAIGEIAFAGTSSIQELNIPNSVVEVGQQILMDWRENPDSNYYPVVNIAYAKESDLPWNEELCLGWNPYWKEGCQPEIIFFQGSYSISYYLNGGTHSDNPISYKPADTFALNDAQRDGYVFDGWYTNPEFTGSRITNIPRGSSGNKVFYAKWIANTYEIVYDSNKPTSASNQIMGETVSSTHEYDTNKVLTNNGFSLTGWRFSGWNSQADGSGVLYTNGQRVINLTSELAATITLYAQWEASNYQIAYVNNKPRTASGMLEGVMQNSTHGYDCAAPLTLNAYTLVGWTFVAWNTQSDGSGSSFEDAQVVSNLTNLESGVITLYAQWEAQNYSISYNSNEPSVTESVASGNTAITDCVYDSDAILANNGYSLLGYIFTGWNTKSDGTGISYSAGEEVRNLTDVSNETVTVYAQWRAIQYTIVYNAEKPEIASGMVTGTTSQSHHYYDQAAPLSMNGFVLTGWRFKHWKNPSEDKLFSNGQIVKNLAVEDNAVLYLNLVWDSKEYKINYEKNRPLNASYTVSSEMSSTMHKYDEPSKLQSNTYTLTGWTFKGWSNALGSQVIYIDQADVLNLTATEDDIVYLYAIWEANQYTVSFNACKPSTASHDVVGSMSSLIMTYDTAHKLALNQFSLTGWTFLGWSSSPNGQFEHSDGERISNLIADDQAIATLYACWQANTCTIIFSNNRPAGHAAQINGSPADIILTYDTETMLSGRYYATVGYKCQGWNTNSNGSGRSFGLRDIVKNLTPVDGATITFYAQWIKTYRVTFIIEETIYVGMDQDTGEMIPWEDEYYDIVAGNQTGFPNPYVSGYKILWREYVNGNPTHNTYYYGDTITATRDVTYYGETEELSLNECLVGAFYEIYTANQFKQLSSQPNGGAGRNYSVMNDLVIDVWSPIVVFYGSIGASNHTVTINRIEGVSAETVGGFAYISYGAIHNIKFRMNIQVDKNVKTVGLIVGKIAANYMLDCTAYGDINCYKNTVTNGAYGVNEGTDIQRVYHEGSINRDSCVASGTLITLADGRQVPVEELRGDELLLVWNLLTGEFESAPILFIDSDAEQNYQVVQLSFSDGTIVEVIGEHGFWNFDLNRYVFLNAGAQEYIGHWFNKQIFDELGAMQWTKVQLIDVAIKTECTQAWSPVTYEYLCYYVNGMLSMPAATEGLINIFEVNGETMQYDEESFLADVEQYGLFTYEEFAMQLEIPKEIFTAFGGQYLKVSMAKGYITWEDLRALVSRYSDYFKAI